MKKYEEPTLKLHQLKTARIMAASRSNVESFQEGVKLSGTTDRSSYFDGGYDE